MFVNGILKSEKDEITLEQYLLKEGYILTRIVVELNGCILPRADYTKVTLSEDDRLEIVHFVGGG